MKTQYIKIVEDDSKYYYSDAAMKILHRIDGPAIEYADGYKAWWVDGKLHRLDGPAVELNSGSKEWWVDGKIHRLDGPAIEYVGGYVDGYKSWYINGKYFSKEDFIRLTAKEIVLTMDQIAAKFGVDVNNLKITK
jgi:hypothetical protein